MYSIVVGPARKRKQQLMASVYLPVREIPQVMCVVNVTHVQGARDSSPKES